MAVAQYRKRSFIQMQKMNNSPGVSNEGDLNGYQGIPDLNIVSRFQNVHVSISKQVYNKEAPVIH